MIRIYLSPPTEPSINFFNDCPKDPLVGGVIRHEEMENQWIKILDYIAGRDAAIDAKGFDDVFLSLISLLKTKKVEIPLDNFELINGDIKTGFYWEDEGWLEIKNFGFFGKSLRADWLF